MTCSQCGSPLKSGALFCGRCGTKCTHPTQPTPTATPYTQEPTSTDNTVKEMPMASPSPLSGLSSANHTPLLIGIIVLLLIVIAVVFYTRWSGEPTIVSTTPSAVPTITVDDTPTTLFPETTAELIIVETEADLSQGTAETYATETETPIKSTSSTLALFNSTGSSDGFVTYYSKDYKYFIELPDNFSILMTQDNEIIFSDGVSFIAVEALENSSALTPQSYSDTYGKPSLYNRVGENFYAESDYDQDNNIYYKYARIYDRVIVTYSATYPESQREFFDEALILISSSITVQ